ncbi:hypothetical protein ACFLQI_02015 [Candidatus Undinarchaeota archaeon]
MPKPNKKLSHKKHPKTSKPVAVGIKTNMEIELVFTKADLPLLRKAVKTLETL